MEKLKNIEYFIIFFKVQTHREKGIFICIVQELIIGIFSKLWHYCVSEKHLSYENEGKNFPCQSGMNLFASPLPSGPEKHD